MKLHNYKFILAAALTILIIGGVVTLLVLMSPELLKVASGGLPAMNDGNRSWSLSLMGYLKGLCFWSIFIGLAVWLFNQIYYHL